MLHAEESKEFMLDYDCYSIGATEPKDAEKSLMEYNKVIGKLFEECIGNRLRQKMHQLEQ